MRIDRIAAHALHAPGISAEKDADLVVRPVALMDADFLPAALREIDQLVRRETIGLFEQRAEPSAQRAARDIGAPESILHNWVVGAANFERSFAGANMKTGLAREIGLKNKLSEKLQFGLCGMRTHKARNGSYSL